MSRHPRETPRPGSPGRPQGPSLALLPVLSALAVSLMGVEQCQPSTGVVEKIMPLGDSITDGYFIPGGYRIDLEDQLIAGGVTPDFVGSLENGPPSLADQNHEGHSGWRIDQISAEIDGWLQSYQPELVLLMIGTNDVLQSYQIDTAPDRLSMLMDQILESASMPHLSIATLTPLSDPDADAVAQTYNAAIPALVSEKFASGASVSMVDMHGALTVDDLIDGVHPNAAGYSKMAQVWTTEVLALQAGRQ